MKEYTNKTTQVTVQQDSRGNAIVLTDDRHEPMIFIDHNDDAYNVKSSNHELQRSFESFAEAVGHCVLWMHDYAKPMTQNFKVGRETVSVISTSLPIYEVTS